MKAKVIAPTNVYNEPRKVGEVLEVDEITFRNLAKKGRLAEAAADDLKAESKKEK